MPHVRNSVDEQTGGKGFWQPRRIVSQSVGSHQSHGTEACGVMPDFSNHVPATTAYRRTGAQTQSQHRKPAQSNGTHLELQACCGAVLYSRFSSSFDPWESRRGGGTTTMLPSVLRVHSSLTYSQIFV